MYYSTEQDEEIAHLKADKWKILEYEIENIDSEANVEQEVTMLTKLQRNIFYAHNDILTGHTQ
jgi:hypothetical protein